MYQLSIPALVSFEEALKNAQDALQEQYDNTDSAMRTLAEEDFTGSAQISCIDRFNTWIGEYAALEGTYGVIYESILEPLRQGANKIVRLCDELPSYLGAGCEHTPDDTGRITLFDEQDAVYKSINEACDAMRKEKQMAEDAISEIEAAHCTCGIDSLTSIIGRLDANTTKLNDFAGAFAYIVRAIEALDECTEASINAFVSGDTEALNQFSSMASDPSYAIGGLPSISDMATYGIAFGAALSWKGSGTWTKGMFNDPAKIHIGYSEGQIRLQDYVKGDHLTSHFSVKSIMTNPKLRSLISFKGFKIAGGVATAAFAIGDIATSASDEYNKNPYLPKYIRDARAEAAGEASVVKNGASIGADAIAGAAIGGLSLGPAGVIAGAAIGTAVGALVDLADQKIDWNNNGKSNTEDYIERRSQEITEEKENGKTTAYDRANEYSYHGN
jgi:hypothetical protein